MRVIAAAIRNAEGVTFTMPEPNRHADIMRAMARSAVSPRGCEQGFILDDGRFATRSQALPIAMSAEQVIGGRLIGSTLTTEDLW